MCIEEPGWCEACARTAQTAEWTSARQAWEASQAYGDPEPPANGADNDSGSAAPDQDDDPTEAATTTECQDAQSNHSPATPSSIYAYGEEGASSSSAEEDTDMTTRQGSDSSCPAGLATIDLTGDGE